MKGLNHTRTGDSNSGKARKLLISLNHVHQPWLICTDSSDLHSDRNRTNTQSHSSVSLVVGYTYVGIVHLRALESTALVLLWRATASNAGHFHVDGRLIQVVRFSIITQAVPAASSQTTASTISKLDDSLTTRYKYGGFIYRQQNLPLSRAMNDWGKDEHKYKNVYMIYEKKVWNIEHDLASWTPTHYYVST